MKTKTAAVGLLVASAALLAGCASSAGSPHDRPSGERAMSGMSMPGGSSTGSGEMTAGMVMPDGSTMAPGSPGIVPSDAAKMICTDETRDNIATVLAVAPAPKPIPEWDGGTYACTYRFSVGTIALSVHESADATAAAAYTGRVHRAMPGAKSLSGLTDRAYGTKSGVVVLQKDNDTLRVDTSALRQRSDPLYARRAAIAYEIAAVIMGCWTGG